VPLRNFRICGDLRQNQRKLILWSWPGWRASETAGPFTLAIGHAHICPSSSIVRKIYHHSPQSSAFYVWSRTAAFTFPSAAQPPQKPVPGSVPSAVIQQALSVKALQPLRLHPLGQREDGHRRHVDSSLGRRGKIGRLHSCHEDRRRQDDLHQKQSGRANPHNRIGTPPARERGTPLTARRRKEAATHGCQRLTSRPRNDSPSISLNYAKRSSP
jgi:hypothetical protein